MSLVCDRNELQSMKILQFELSKSHPFFFPFSLMDSSSHAGNCCEVARYTVL
jgi:hypothetical protein